MPQPLGELSALLWRREAPLVATYHADIYRQRSLLFLYRPLVLRLLRAADRVVTASAALGMTSPLLRAASVPVDVVPYGINVEYWAPENANRGLVKQLRQRYGSPYLVSVGRLVAYKGFDRLIAAAPELSCSVVIIGDGREKVSIKRKIAKLGLEEKVHLVGEVEDHELAAHLAAASAFVLPSLNRAEAFGIALLEAQAAQLPVIATDVGTGTTEAFRPGESGLSIPPDDCRALVSAINALVGNPQLRRKMGKEGRRFVEQKHSLQSLDSARTGATASLTVFAARPRASSSAT
jgi:glycosyltransferase involved in cell wall biosynthesis